jgi:hypothetical protein
MHHRDEIVLAELADEVRQRITDQARTLRAHLVIGEHDGEDPYVVAARFALFGVAVQHLPRPRGIRDCAVDSNLAEQIDRLRPAVFDNLEVLFGEIGNRVTAGVRDDDVDTDDIDAGAERGLRIWLTCSCSTRLRGR